MRTVRHTRFMVAVLFLIVLLTLTGCGKSGSDGARGPAGPSGVEIHSIVASPAVVRPGANTNLVVSASDGVNSALTYSWQADAGALSSGSTSSVTWTAPASIGSYLVSVEVTNAAGLKSRGYASILVSVSPAGPIVTSVNPTEVKAGDQIRITGAGFGSAQGTSSVNIGGTPASSVISWSDSVITATVPAGATTGSVVVTEAGVNSSPGFIVVLWTNENPENVAIYADADTLQDSPHIISDGSGGAIISFQDARSGTWDIYAQRVNSAGAVQWTAGGVAITTAAYTQYYHQLISDGSGGAIIAWEDSRSNTAYHIYAQRVNSAGVVQWTVDGVAISSTTAGNQTGAQLISDNSGGAIITWNDDQGGNSDVYAQRVNSAGAVQWTVDGVAVSEAIGHQFYAKIASDSTGGAIITWQDLRSGQTYTDEFGDPVPVSEIYAQRVNSAGAVQWTTDGVVISTAGNGQFDPKLISDNSGGAIITWVDSRTTATITDIYAQRVNSAGAVQWTPNGVAISTAANDQSVPQLISDGSGGAIITWMDSRNTATTGLDIYAQRVTSSGAVQWKADGVAISTAENLQWDPQLIADGSGGAIIAWYDYRNITATGIDIYAQRVNSAGLVQWTLDGYAISTAATDQLIPQLTSDGSGGAVITWADRRNGGAGIVDIYAQGISASGRQ